MRRIARMLIGTRRQSGPGGGRAFANRPQTEFKEEKVWNARNLTRLESKKLHMIWVQRGQPLGSPKEDWFLAEQLLGHDTLDHELNPKVTLVAVTVKEKAGKRQAQQQSKGVSGPRLRRVNGRGVTAVD